MAVWQSGGVGVLAPNAQAGTLAELSAGTRGLVTDDDRTTRGVDVVAARQPSGPTSRRWTVLDREGPRLELFTSGSTGARKAVPKTIANLEDEVAGLDRQWGPRLPGREVFGTVSHQHIYGLLFRVLWPLAAGRTFRGETYLQPEEMAAAMASGPAGCLITSPAHLEPAEGLSRAGPHRRALRADLLVRRSGRSRDRGCAARGVRRVAVRDLRLHRDRGRGLAPAGRHRRRGDVDALLRRGRRGGLRGAAARALALRERAGRRVHAGRPRRRAARRAVHRRPARRSSRQGR